MDKILDEETYKIKPPMQAYFFFPNQSDTFIENPTDPCKSRRIFFEGNIEYTTFEKNKMKEFMEEINKYNKNNLNDQILIPFNWSVAETLKCLQSTTYNFPKSIILLKDYLHWRLKVDKIVLTEKILEILNTGFFYVCGRDSRFRPIIVQNFNKYKKYTGKYTDQEYEEAIIYFMQYVVKNLLIPGQIENWNVIVDKGDYNIFSIPTGIMNIARMLQNNYRSRLYKGFVFGFSGFWTFLWIIVKSFLDESTNAKITIMDSSNKNLLFDLINKEQLEKKYGGDIENIEEGHFFPPNNNNQNYLIKDESSEILMTENSYIEKVMKDDRIAKSPYRKRYSLKIKFGNLYHLYFQYNNSIFTRYLQYKHQIYQDYCTKYDDEVKKNKVQTENIYITSID